MPSTSAAVAENHVVPFSSVEDYVIVQQPDEIRNNNGNVGDFRGGDNENDDDDSYDYCEDAFSHGSADADDQDDDHSVDLTVGSESGDAKDSIVITVPSVLMKDLDDAHAAAELARASDDSLEDNEGASAPDEETSAEEPNAAPETQASAPSTSNKAEEKVLEATQTTSTTENSVKHPSAAAKSTSSAPPVTLSRTSNKKRRKKLKLMKKAQAAANAAHLLSGRSVDGNNDKQANKGKKTTSPSAGPGRSASRKIANIAVVCARETMASYRHEVLCSGMGKQSCF